MFVGLELSLRAAALLGSAVSAYATYAFAADFDDSQYWVGGTKYTPISALPGYTYTRTGEQGAVKSQTYGPELTTNGEFTSNVTGWGGYGGQTTTWDTGKAVVSAAADAGLLQQVTGLTVGKSYRLRVLVTASNNTVNLAVGDSLGSPLGVATKGATVGVETSLQFTATATSHYVGLYGTSVTYSTEYVRLDELLPTVEYFAANVPAINNLGYHAYGALTNLVTYSQDFGNAAWTSGGVSVTANTVVAPDGTTTADTLTEDAANSEHRIYQSIAMEAGTGTWSVVAKAGTRNWLAIRNNAASICANFNLSTGVVGTNTGGAYIVDLGGGWYRCVAIGAQSSPLDFMTLNMGDADTGLGAAYAYAGNGTGTIHLWQGQQITGNFPDGGPIIRTAGATASIGASDLATTGNPYTTEQDFVVWGTINFVKPFDASSFDALLALGNNSILLFRDNGGTLKVRTGASPLSSGVSFTGTGRATILYRRRAGKESIGVRANGVTTIVEAGVAAPWPNPTTTLKLGTFGGLDHAESPLEGVFGRTGTFSDAEVQAILESA